MFGQVLSASIGCTWPMSCSSNDTFSFHNNRMDDGVMGSKPTESVYKLIIKKAAVASAFFDLPAIKLCPTLRQRNRVGPMARTI